ncbi:MAG: hypothetical protein JNK15_07845 [Planctomycetes bacterium]|nr:hypothetical protein [Planctomycetota bacterium]
MAAAIALVRAFAACGLAAGLMAQGDTVTLDDGTVYADVRVVAFDVQALKFVRANVPDQVASDRVARVELAKVHELLAAAPDVAGVLAMAREQAAAKNPLVAQMLFAAAAGRSQGAAAVAVWEELATALPAAGLTPEAFRRRFAFQLGLGGKGQATAAAVAKKYLAEAIRGVWPAGFALEAEFLLALAERGNARVFQGKLRTLIDKTATVAPVVHDRARVELAHMLAASKEGVDEARGIFDSLATRDGVDATARGGAWLGLGRLGLAAAGDDKNALRKAMLAFLRVGVECADAWPNVRAEALCGAITAAQRWRGPDHARVVANCRAALRADFAGTEWAESQGR